MFAVALDNDLYTSNGGHTEHYVGRFALYGRMQMDLRLFHQNRRAVEPHRLSAMFARYWHGPWHLTLSGVSSVNA